MRRCVAGWWYGYWTKVKKYRVEMVQKLMESFDVDAALLAWVGEFDRTALIMTTPFADVDEHLEGIKSELGINQGWCAESEAAGQRVDIVGHNEALAMTLQDRVDDVDDAARRVLTQG